MKSFGTIIAIFGILVAVASTSAAQEFGADISSSAQLINTGSSATNLDERLGLWLRGGSGSWSYSISGHGEYQNQSLLPKPGFLDADFDLLKLSYDSKSPQEGLSGYSFTIGRDFISDSTGYVFSNPADGLAFSFLYPNVKLAFKFDYTGLVQLSSSTVDVSLVDDNRLAALTQWFGSPRFLAVAELDILNAFGQEIAISGIAQQDLNPASDLVQQGQKVQDQTRGGPVNTEYAGIQLSGPIFDSLFHTTFFTYGFGRELSYLPDSTTSTGYSYQPVAIRSWLAGTQLNYYMTDFYSSAINFKFLLASGDKDAARTTEGSTTGDENSFAPVTTTTLGTVFSPKLSNLVFIQAGMSAKPFERQDLLAILNLMTFFRSTSGPISIPGLKPGSDKAYLGSEVDLAVNYQIFSDLGISLSTGAFIPGVDPAGAFDSSYQGLQYSMKLTATLSL